MWTNIYSYFSLMILKNNIFEQSNPAEVHARKVIVKGIPIEIAGESLKEYFSKMMKIKNLSRHNALI